MREVRKEDRGRPREGLVEAKEWVRRRKEAGERKGVFFVGGSRR